MTLAAAILFAAGSPAAMTLTQETQMKNLAWLEGRWQGKAFGGTMEESYSSPAGGCILGTSRVVGADGSLIHKEFIEISPKDGKPAYQVMLPSKAHAFPLVEMGASFAEWADPKNSFPSRIRYERKGTKLEVTLSGSSESGQPTTERITLTRVSPGP